MCLMQLEPVYKEYLWGGNKLIEQYHKPYSGERLAESWELSCHGNGMSYVKSPAGERETLEEFLNWNGRKVLGEACRPLLDFPILIKYIDAKEPLSVQVHPDDAYSLEHEHQYGKTEMWYILECNPGAWIYYGFSRKTDRAEVKARIENGTLPEILNKVYVKPGDSFLINAGTIHAIGKGIVLAEIQQNSDVTYRVYDYERTDQQGNQRELHIDRALDVLHYDSADEDQAVFGKEYEHCLVDSRYFKVFHKKIEGIYRDQVKDESFVCLMVTEGHGEIRMKEQILKAVKGQSYFMEAGSDVYELEGQMEILYICM
ncbi:type I phosphomannose isomerase catalytic subunit [uncultured Robinsoniella sp.]|uniref:type I phosphomannose isomerase catalytic subunit n=1 Tax=uncultured Robinsoniella sp. TaxID=904190 RepID=UPI00374E4908